MKGNVLILLFSVQFCFAQNGFTIPNGAKKTVIPFQLINNLIFIPVQLNGVDLTFLIDTGVSQTLLISLEDKEIAFENQEKVLFSGFGGKLKVEGLKSTNNFLKITDNYIDHSHSIYIIQNENFNFSSFIGIPVNGIIGYDFFKDHKVEIDYISNKITVYNNDRLFRNKSLSFEKIPVSGDGNKLYIDADLTINNEYKTAKLLIDLGNSDALWIFPQELEINPASFSAIDDFLGRGFSGDIKGLRGRIERISIGNFTLRKPITAMPDSISSQNLEIINDRKGSIGSEIMRRFKVILDYPEKNIYLKMNKNFGDAFRYNMSGLEFKHIGETYETETIKLNIPTSTPASTVESTRFGDYLYKFVLKPVFAIAGVRPNSPAALAGIKSNDVLQKINGKSTSYSSLTELNAMMKEDEGKSFTFEVLRGGLPLQFKFILKDPLPNTEQP